MNRKDLEKEIKSLENKEKIKVYANFFKTKKGEYGEGDTFLGLTVPQQRKIAHKYLSLNLEDIKSLLQSNIHEFRFTALEILVAKYEHSPELQKEIANFYIKNASLINNWDLVDTTAPYILGHFLKNREKSILIKLAKSKNLWEKRIAIISTLSFIQDNKFEDTLKIAEILLRDDHDLIHKAVGWMLREVGKRNKQAEEKFLRKHYKSMPRTMLRYAIELFPEEERKAYLKGKI